MVVASVQEDAYGELIITGSQDSSGVLASYRIASKPGPSLVIAWSDENGNFDIDEGDYVAMYPWVVNVTAGMSRTDVDLRMERLIGGVGEVDATGRAYAAYAGELARLLRESADH